MELSKKDMELILPFLVIRSKNFFKKSIPIWSNDSKMAGGNRKWNDLNRKWNYFSPFQSSDQKLLLRNYPHLLQRFQNGFQNQEMELSKQEMELFLSFLVIGSKNSLKKVSPFGPTIPKWFEEAGNRII
jgi:hypothetical protein